MTDNLSRTVCLRQLKLLLELKLHRAS